MLGAIKNTGKKCGSNTEIYGPHVDQSECRILESHVIIPYNYYVVL